MVHILSSGDFILEVLKRQVLISYFVQCLLNRRNNVIWLQLCLSILANYQFLHLQTRVRNSLRSDRNFSLFSLNLRQMSVHNPDAVQNGVFGAVDVSTLDSATCRGNNRTIVTLYLISRAKPIRHIFEMLTDKASLYWLTN